MMLVAVCGAMSMVLGPHWVVSNEEAKAWGKALEAWVKAQPPKRRKALAKVLAAAPTLNLVATTGMIFAPRVAMTVEMAKRRRKNDGKEVATGNGAGGVGEAPAGGEVNPSGYDFASAVANALGKASGGSGQGSTEDASEVRREGSNPIA